MIRTPVLVVLVLTGASFASVLATHDEDWDIELTMPAGHGATFFKVHNPNGIDHREVLSIMEDRSLKAGFGLLYIDLIADTIFPLQLWEGNGSAMGLGYSSQHAYAGTFDMDVREPRMFEFEGQVWTSVGQGWLPRRVNTTDMIVVVYWLQLPDDGFLRMQIKWKDGTTFERLRDGYLRYESTVTMDRGVGVGSNQAARVHVDDGFFSYAPYFDYQRLGILNVQIPGGPAYGTFTLDVGHHNVTEKFYQEQPLDTHAYDCVCPLWWQNVFTTQQDLLVDFDFVGYGRNADINLILITHDNPEVPRDMWKIRKQDLYYDPGPA